MVLFAGGEHSSEDKGWGSASRAMHPAQRDLMSAFEAARPSSGATCINGSAASHNGGSGLAHPNGSGDRGRLPGTTHGRHTGQLRSRSASPERPAREQRLDPSWDAALQVPDMQ